MDEQAFTTFLKKGGRSPSAVRRCLTMVQDFERFACLELGDMTLDKAGPEELAAYVRWVEREPKASAKTHLWALGYYFQFNGNDEMRGLARALREARIERTPFALKDFRGVDQAYAAELADAGVRTVKQMLRAGATPKARERLAAGTGVPVEAVMEFVKLSDLARIPGVKAIRARLYHDAGVDTVEKLAAWEPDALRAMLVEFVERTEFEGIAPLPKEAASAVATARSLPRVVEY